MSVDIPPVSRRRFLVGAAAGSTALLGCGETVARHVIPWIAPPPDAIPGLSLFYRTVCRECSAGCGMTARSREGHVVKLEGNPEHPIGRGALCVRGQASIESLYDPKRLGVPSMREHAGAASKEVSWDAAEVALADALRKALAATRPIFVLSRPEPGAVGTLLDTWLAALGQSPGQRVTFDPLEPAFIRAAASATFGVATQPSYDIAAAHLVLSIGADFLEDWGSPVEHARALSELRAQASEGDRRFVYVGPRLSLTAAAADEWLSVRPGTEIELVLALARIALTSGGAGVSALPAAAVAQLTQSLAHYELPGVEQRTGLAASTIQRLGEQLVRARPSLVLGPGRVVAGHNAVSLARAIQVLNVLTGAVGHTVHWSEPAEQDAQPSVQGLDHLIETARAGRIGVLVVHHADPLRFGAAFGGFTELLELVDFVAVFANRMDELAQRANVVLPDHHFLESWSTVSPRAGVQGIQQPTMSPLLPTRAAADVLLDVARTLERIDGLPTGSFAEKIRDNLTPVDLQRGGIFDARPVHVVALVDDPLKFALDSASLDGPESGLALVVTPSLRHPDDGRSPGALLSEISDPVTGISWSGWVELHPATAATLGVATGDVVRLVLDGRQLDLPVHEHAGLRRDVAAVGAPFVVGLLGRGVDPALGLLSRVSIHKLGRHVALAPGHGSDRQEGRGLALTEAELQRQEGGREHTHLSMYAEHVHPTHRWGLVVDLDRCNGCVACVAACQVENNSPIVGPKEAAIGRTMNWMRIERFVEGSAEHPDLRFVPMMCQQCDNAPCEGVCPVYATYHTAEGLNAQIYNRCVGTRYCENNCPYQARRFNWYDNPHPAPTNLGLNPDVSVRERGVTEKCTFCVQRIREVKEQAKLDGRPLRDGDITPACVQTCPASALAFGDLQDAGSRVAKLADDKRAYHVLGHLNTKPGVTYLARRRRETT